MNEFSIRPVKTMHEIHGIVEVQRQAWQMDDIGIVPTFETKAVSKFGTVLIAVDKNDTVIGFIYAMPQFPDAHYSHMMAVLPEWQGKNIGYELKRYHWKLALNSKYTINHIYWTVDPLLPNNAYLNFAKLGVICNTYYVNFYGSPDGDGVGIYSGLPTDRFLVDWRIRSDRVKRRMNNYKEDRINYDELCERSPIINIVEDDRWISTLDIKNNSFILEVPSDINALKNKNIEIALDWRYKFREFVIEKFNEGWFTTDYHSLIINNKRRNFYEFTKNLENE